CSVGTTTDSYYVHDGHGSVRQLTGQSGTITDTYDYDAFGVLLSSTGSTPNNYRFAGEQFDPDLNLYYNRSRYLSVTTDRFWTMDTYEGDPESPVSLHKYVAFQVDPVNNVDPSGTTIASLIYGQKVHKLIGLDFVGQDPFF